jgi:hypothetical protein
VEQVMAIKESADLSPARLMHLDLENADGAGTRLRLDLRGSSLDATIDLQDPVTTELMRARINELHRALAKVGIEADSIRVQAAARQFDGMEALREARTGTGDVFRLPSLEDLGLTKNETSGSRSQGDTAGSRQDGGRPRHPSQQSKQREEQR